MNLSRLLVLSFTAALVSWLSTDQLRAQDFPTDEPDHPGDLGAGHGRGLASRAARSGVDGL